MKVTNLAAAFAVFTALTSNAALAQFEASTSEGQPIKLIAYSRDSGEEDRGGSGTYDVLGYSKDKNNCSSCECGGWLEQGITFNGYSPNNRYNGVVNMNNRSNDYMMNQLWLYAERVANDDTCGWDWGGRVDVMFGQDGQYMKMTDGWEESWDEKGFYQAATPQVYFDVAHNGWTFRFGRFTAPLGLETLTAVGNFFYSRSYTWFPEPNNLFGFEVRRQVTDNLTAVFGMHRGEDQFNDTDGKNAPDYLAGFEWMSCDQSCWIDAYTIQEERGIGDSTRHYSVVGGRKLPCDWEYAGEVYWANTDSQFNPSFNGGSSEWYGINNHLYKWVNDCWAYGMRFEWFRDDDGNAIYGVGQGNSATGPFVGNFYELTFAVNYMPCPKFVLRPEIRWDWYKADNGGPLPFNDGTKDNQFLVSIDAIYKF